MYYDKARYRAESEGDRISYLRQGDRRTLRLLRLTSDADSVWARASENCPRMTGIDDYSNWTIHISTVCWVTTTIHVHTYTRLVGWASFKIWHSFSVSSCSLIGWNFRISRKAQVPPVLVTVLLYCDTTRTSRIGFSPHISVPLITSTSCAL